MAGAPITADELRPALPTALNVERWVEEMLRAAPYADVEALVEHARLAATPLSEAELDEALAHHPRIGERATDDDDEARMSAAEQAAPDDDDAELNAQIAEGNGEYEARFGRVFLIRAAGRSRAEILIELRRRLALDPETEAATATEQLRQIMELRLRTLFGEAPPAPASARSHITTHVLDTARGRPASHMPVRLDAFSEEVWHELGRGITDDDGRIAQLGPDQVPAGRYRVVFDTAAYFATQDAISFFPEVSVMFDIWSTEEHFHIPLLLSPFGYSTYRGA
ncbi:MAG TPA: 2-oxo-4-hydroxy-4-carboxy-5-ureidoimidazoline decarboxylase [Gryllotalpicola sp.]